jgi:benzaldehyde dehydrogenase (NAD)
MSTEVTDPAADEALLDGDTWSGRIFSDGWVDAPETIETIEPATGEVLGTAGAGNVEAVTRAAASAARAQRDWAATPITDRVAIVRRAAELLERHRPELIRWLVRVGPSRPRRTTRSAPRSGSSRWPPP